jgi:hypothetical protein
MQRVAKPFHLRQHVLLVLWMALRIFWRQNMKGLLIQNQHHPMLQQPQAKFDPKIPRKQLMSDGLTS